MALVCLSCRVVVLESRPTDNPTAQSNLYILAGHENSYWTGTVLKKVLSLGRGPQMKLQCLVREALLGVFVATGCTDLKSFWIHETPLHQQHVTCSSDHGETIQTQTLLCSIFSLLCTVDRVTNKYLEVLLLIKVPLNSKEIVTVLVNNGRFLYCL